MSFKKLPLEFIRGAAAIIVLVAHFVQVFIPKVFSQNTKDHGFGEEFFATSIINIILNANLAVCLFFVLSGYVLTCGNYGKMSSDKLIYSFLKRYPRLAFPAAAAALFAVVMTFLPMNDFNRLVEISGTDIGNAYARDWGIVNALNQGFFGAFIYGRSELNPVLWTMKYELLGSFMIFIFSLVITKVWRFRLFVYLISIILIYFFMSIYFLSFVLGALLNERILNIDGIFKKILLVFSIAAFVYFGSYPYYGAQNAPWNLLPEVKEPFVFWHVLGAFFLVWVIVSFELFSKNLNGFFSFWLGKLSFSIYLVHWPIILVVGGFFVRKYHNLGYLNSLLIGFLASCAVTFFVSILFERFIDSKSIIFSNKISDKLIRSKLIKIIFR